jgi:hypothetical protein
MLRVGNGHMITGVSPITGSWTAELMLGILEDVCYLCTAVSSSLSILIRVRTAVTGMYTLYPT